MDLCVDTTTYDNLSSTNLHSEAQHGTSKTSLFSP